MPVVYKITRTDGKEYIGVAVNFQSRLCQHTKSDRFDIGISNHEILFESENYDECLEQESRLVVKFDTYRNGLNRTPDGSGNHHSERFTTKGYQFTEDQKANMRNAWKSKKESGWKRPSIPHTEETKAKLSEVRSGKIWGPTKLNQEVADRLREQYGEVFIVPVGVAKKMVKKTLRENYAEDMTSEEFLNTNPVSGGGQKLAYDRVFCHVMGKSLGVNPNTITRIIKNETWVGAVRHDDNKN